MPMRQLHRFIARLALLWFVLAMLLGLAAMIVFPELALWLPRRMGMG